MAVGTVPDRTTSRDLRDRGWFPLAASLALLLVLGVVVVRVAHHEVVVGWRLLATCPAPADAIPPSVSATLDTSACSADPSEAVDGRGWPVVATLLPASAGETPDVTRLRADKAAHTVVVDYRASATPSSSAHLVFVEVPPGSLPDTPVTVTSARQG